MKTALAPAPAGSPTTRRATGQYKSIAWAAGLGIAFWFVVGFPFGNHNESYFWVVYFARHSFWDACCTHLLAVTRRPLGQGLAYLGWRMGGGSSWPVQIFSAVTGIVALWSIALATAETATFAVGMAAAGGTFFAGYIYLFHVHGIFYSPVLVTIALLLHLWKADRQRVEGWELGVFACGLTIGLLFHPYALILTFTFWIGRTLERWKGLSGRERWMQIALILVVLAAILVSRPSWNKLLPMEDLRGLLASYRMSETPAILALVAALFAAATVLGIEKIGWKPRVGMAGAVLLCAFGLHAAGIPVVVLWVAVAIARLIYLRNWPVAWMTLAAAVLPGVAPSGSPTYAIFAIVLSVFALAAGSCRTERALRSLPVGLAPAVAVAAMLLAFTLRMGVRIPVLWHVARPLIAEREKTEQLEDVVNWMLASRYRSWNLEIGNYVNPIDSESTAMNRVERPPTYQNYLDAYLASRRPGPADGGTLFVTFGGDDLKGMTPVYVVSGRAAGAAMVFAEPKAVP